MVHILPADSRAEALKVDVARLRFLDRFLTELTTSGGYPFCGACVLRGGTEIFNGAYGIASPEGAPLQLDTIYPMASVTKPITATLLAMLQEDGVIDLWEKFNKYYPDFTGDKKDEVEIWQVMAHSSGMSDEAQMEYIIQSVRENGIDLPENFTYEDYDAALLKIREKLGLPMTGDYARDCEETQEYLYLKAPLAADPHTVFSYCNHAYFMLAKLIERLTGEDIDSYASRRLFLPLGMTDTHFILPKEKWPRVVKRDPALQGAEWLNSEFILENTSGAGGLKSTVSDLALFGQMYLNGGRLGA
ncbi:MAG: beta-lactamase family protein, partial [Clostridiales bacterium]|nr:beta-lactamase family protein [Clostridiales bacterium]